MSLTMSVAPWVAAKWRAMHFPFCEQCGCQHQLRAHLKDLSHVNSAICSVFQDLGMPKGEEPHHLIQTMRPHFKGTS